MPPPVQRPTELFERHWPWFLIGVGATAGLIGVAALAGRTLRGYTAPGLLLGLAAVGFAALTFAYSLRKRVWQEAAPSALRGTMMAWLWAHVYFGLLAFVAAVFHAGAGLLTTRLSSGLVLLALFGLLAFSGVVWRLIYRYVPPAASARVGNYSQSESSARAQNALIEIEKLCAGKPDEFQRLKDELIAGSAALESAGLSDSDRADFETVRALALDRQRALRRMKLQEQFDGLLQFWKTIHIPLTGLALALLVLHILVVFDLPAQALPLQMNGFRPASECGQCHAAIYAQWSQSMHAHALTSPVTIAQVNQVMASTFAEVEKPDPYLFCNNCHGPVAARLTRQATLPMKPPSRSAEALVLEGVSCTACHQFNGQPGGGRGGLREFNRSLRPGRVYFGSLADPVGNAYHQGQSSEIFVQPEQLCRNCHNVTLDRNEDGQIEKGVDLILQTIYTEWERYRDAGGTETCVSCHMPPIPGLTRIAEAAEIPAEQDAAAPPRVVHDHSFVGVDYPLDTVTRSDPQREARQALLGRAASLAVDDASYAIGPDGSLRFQVIVGNVGAGHNIPGGFSFARQMWLEVAVADQDGAVWYQSGVLLSNTDDLCDSGTMDDPGNPAAEFVQGCAASDPQLVNFQQKLVSQVAQVPGPDGTPLVDDHGDPIVRQPETAEETWLQSLEAGSVSRFRPIDGQELDTIDPGQSRVFEYQTPGQTGTHFATITVRLLYRNFPPYLLRALAANQLPTDPVLLGPLIGNLQVVEMAAQQATVDFP